MKCKNHKTLPDQLCEKCPGQPGCYRPDHRLIYPKPMEVGGNKMAAYCSKVQRYITMDGELTDKNGGIMDTGRE